VVQAPSFTAGTSINLADVFSAVMQFFLDFISRPENINVIGIFVIATMTFMVFKAYLNWLPRSGSRVERNFVTIRRMKAYRDFEYKATGTVFATSANVVVA